MHGQEPPAVGMTAAAQFQRKFFSFHDYVPTRRPLSTARILRAENAPHAAAQDASTPARRTGTAAIPRTCLRAFAQKYKETEDTAQLDIRSIKIRPAANLVIAAAIGYSRN